MAFINNGSNTTNITYDYDETYSFIPELLRFRTGCLLFISVVGTPLNLWFLAAILSSPVIRSRLRNKIICNSFVLHLLNCAFVLPITTVVPYTGNLFPCSLLFMFSNIDLLQEFVVNWLLIMLIAVFIAQIEDFSPRSRLSSRTVTAGTLGLLVFPWVASLVVVPVIVHEYHKNLSDIPGYCKLAGFNTVEVFRSIDTALPIILAILLVIAAAFMRYRRFTLRTSPGSMQTELLDRGPEIDSTLVYVVAVVVATLCDLLRLSLDLNTITFGKDVKTMYYVQDISNILSDSRAILAPFIWLLLPDIRQRIRTWRPCYRPAPGIDLTIAYTKEGS